MELSPDVSAKALDGFFRAARRRGIRDDALTAGLDYCEDALRDTRAHIDWPSFRIFMGNVSRAFGDDELDGLGREFLRAPAMRPVALVARLLFDAQDFYRWVLRDRAASSYFRCISVEYSEPGPASVRVRMRYGEGHEPCVEFLQVSRGTFAEMPRIVGLAATSVELTQLADGAVFDIALPQGGAVLPRIARWLAAPLTGVRTARVLKRAHEELQLRFDEVAAARDELEQRVETRTAELALTVSQLRAAQRARDDFFANITHELRSPLTMVLAPLQQLRRTVENNELVDSMERNALRLLRSVNQLLEIAKLDSGARALDLTSGNPGECFLQTVEAAEQIANSRGLSLSHHGLESLPVCLFDRSAIQVIADNLVGNAIKFCAPGDEIRVSGAQRGDEISISVDDTGPGIPADQRELVFERFAQADSSRQRPHEGTGIGLALARDLARSHAGSLTLTSKPNEGSTFTLTFPLRTSPDAGDSTSLAPRPQEARSPSSEFMSQLLPRNDEIVWQGDENAPPILVAEDNPELRAFLASSLAEHFRVCAVSDGLQAQELLVEHAFVGVVSDVTMPKMDGIALCRWCREHTDLRSVPFLLLTARDSLSDVLEGLEVGATDYVRKPFEPAELVARLKNHIRTRALEERAEEYDSRLMAIGRVSQSLVHDLRNAVAAIAATAEFADNPADMEPAMRTIRERSEAMARQLQELLDYTRGEVALEIENVSSLALLENTMAGWKAIFEASRIEVRTSLVPDTQISVDRARVTRVIDNLLANARDALLAFQKPGERSLAVEVERRGDALAVRVSDSGPGINPSLGDSLFSSGASTKPNGMGLGLAMSRNIARSLGGDLTLVTQEGGSGTTFELLLPAANPNDTAGL